MNSVFGETIYTGRGMVPRSYLTYAGKQIVGITKKPSGKLVGRFPAITPAFIDPHSHIGLWRAGEPGEEGDGNDRFNSVMTLCDALDSVQMDDKAFSDAIEAGVLYSCIVPGSGNIIGGRAAVIRHYTSDSTSALIAGAGVKAALGYNPNSAQDWKGDRPSTRMGTFRILRTKLDDVRIKLQKLRLAKGARKKEMIFTAEETVLRDILQGREHLRVHVHKIDDIASLLRLAEEFRIRITVEHAGDVHKREIFDQLKKRGIWVDYGPIDSFAYKVELKHEDWRNIRLLVDSGVSFGLMTDHPVTLSRQLFLQTRWFLRAGWTHEQAVGLVSRQNARLLGIDKFLGSLEKGKWASFTAWSGDPFDWSSFPAAVFGEGQLLFTETR